MILNNKELLNRYSNGERDFSDINLSKTYFDQIILSGSDLSDANFNKSQFLQCSFEQTDFSRANLSNTVMTECTLDGSNFSFANLSNSYLEGKFYNVSFENANLRTSILLFDHDLLEGITWKNADLTGTVFFDGFYHPRELLGKLNYVDTSQIIWLRSESDLNNLQLNNYNPLGIEKLKHLFAEIRLNEEQ